MTSACIFSYNQIGGTVKEYRVENGIPSHVEVDVPGSKLQPRNQPMSASATANA